MRSRRWPARPRREGTIARFTETILNVLSLLLVGVGIAVTATFFVSSPPHDAEAKIASTDTVDKTTGQPQVPVDAEKIQKAIDKEKGATKGDVSRGPNKKMLRMTIPKMAQIRNDTIPYSVSDDENAFREHAAVHLRGTGNPWDKVANVYIAGHRLGYPGTNSWLAFWDLNVLKKGDRIFVTDAAGKRYVYKVFRIFVVAPDRVSVTRPLAGRNVLSLQTCTLPDYSRRLIVQAEMVA